MPREWQRLAEPGTGLGFGCGGGKPPGKAASRSRHWGADRAQPAQAFSALGILNCARLKRWDGAWGLQPADGLPESSSPAHCPGILGSFLCSPVLHLKNCSVSPSGL